MFSIFPRIIAEEVVPMMRMADELARWPLTMSRYMAHPLNRLGESEVHNTDKEFRVRMDLQHFKAEEIKITSDDQRVTVSAKHEEKQDEHCFVAREFTRTYKMPEDVDPKSITSALTEHGILNIKIQKKTLVEPKETPIPVNFKNNA
uniref:SHSP domain-containing protein n=1 Tax=Arion vulgaris TaxID=1028688 RepID=A0A0B6XYN4_9EUPU